MLCFMFLNTLNIKGIEYSCKGDDDLLLVSFCFIYFHLFVAFLTYFVEITCTERISYPYANVTYPIGLTVKAYV